MPNVLITGCSSGFGRLAAVDLARRGDRVFATVRRPDAGRELAELAESEKLPLSVHQLDVTDAQAVERVVSEVAALDHIDVLINNAGMALRGPVEAVADDELSHQFDTNVFGVVRMVRAVVPLMRRRGSGTIVNLSSIAGLVGAPFEGAYAASKHAVEGLTETLRFELASAGIHVLLIEPGAYETDFSANMAEARAFDGGHPLRAAYEQFSEALASGLHAEGRADAREVVEALLDAVDHPDGPFRRLVGRDAEMIGTAKREHSFEEFAAAIQSSLNVDPASLAAAGDAR